MSHQHGSIHSPLQAGHYYHIYNRGNNRENLFLEERNYRYFLQLYAKYVHPVVDTFAYCLMRNHFHLLVRVKPEAVVQRSERFKRSDRLDPATRALTSLFQAYAMAFNKAYQRTGKLFEEHFGRIEVTQPVYFTNLVHYIHFNPQKHGFTSHFREWPWSSYGALRGTSETRLRRDEVVQWFGALPQFESFHISNVVESAITPLIVDDWD